MLYLCVCACTRGKQRTREHGRPPIARQPRGQQTNKTYAHALSHTRLTSSLNCAMVRYAHLASLRLMVDRSIGRRTTMKYPGALHVAGSTGWQNVRDSSCASILSSTGRHMSRTWRGRLACRCTVSCVRDSENRWDAARSSGGSVTRDAGGKWWACESSYMGRGTPWR